jgi:Bacterial capsule synthesis protein PGA_cap
VGLAIALGSLAVAATYEPTDRAITNLGSTVATRLANPLERATTLPSFTAEAELLAVGDVMMHGMQIKSGERGGGAYHFDHFFAAVRDRLSAADWAVANLETVLGGGGAYTGYPMFNAPPALADALHNAGFAVSWFAGLWSTGGMGFWPIIVAHRFDRPRPPLRVHRSLPGS